MDEDKLSEKEQQLFHGLKNEMDPPAQLEEKIIVRLAEEGLLQKKNTSKAYLKIAVAIAAGVLVFMGGLYFGKERSETSVAIDPEHGYMLILYEDQNFKQGNPSEMAIEYGQWMQNAIDGGINMTGHELNAKGAIIDGQKRVVMLADNQEKRTTGYFILEASSFEKAINMAMNSPHIKYGGTMEIRPIIGH